MDLEAQRPPPLNLTLTRVSKNSHPDSSHQTRPKESPYCTPERSKNMEK